jgi:hypothetical protein
MPINPAFHHFSAEAAIIGRLLAAFGELEVTVCYNAAKATNLSVRDSVDATLYRIRTTRSRLEAADALMRPIYTAADLTEAYVDAFGRVMQCLRIRNQFAHCNWGDHETTGLFFVDLQVAAERPDFAFHWKHVDVPLLERHETCFEGALEALRFADHEMAVKQGKLQSHFWPKPPALSPPPLHNPEAQHIPPWLESDEKARHIARAQAAQQSAPTPTPAQLALERAREEKRARRQADRDRDLAGRSDPEAQP